MGTNAVVLTIVAVVVVAAIVVGVVITMKRSSQPSTSTPNYPVTRSGTVVTAGQASAPVTVDLYTDYLCPYCERLETTYRDRITTALNDGKVRINYHAIAILDRSSNPPGYSTLAANASLCAADAGVFPAFNNLLFDKQPAEGSAGYTAAQLAQMGTSVGAPPSFAQCVTANAAAAQVKAATQKAASDPNLQTNGSFGTPTVAVNGKKVDINSNWLPA